ncbi:MAG TPA: helix-turn-helix domain-containing protein [Bacillota bacterium]|nr:helix-turn-helix domain-containing protein [Bacillota bacterium]
MEHTLKVTNVLSDPTRFKIYQYLVQHHEAVTVNEISEQFDIHPNVARMHLTKLEDINLLISYSEKTGRGGRPSRLYSLSEKVIELNFPHRDYKLFANIALETLAELGEPGKKALYETGRKYGLQVMERYHTQATMELTNEQKVQILEDAGVMLGLYPDLSYNPEEKKINFTINNCPFKEIAQNNHSLVCNMHLYFLKGMFESLFTDLEFVENENMFKGCENCTYTAKLSAV